MMSYKDCQLRHEKAYIYKIVNDINTKIYVGCSTSPEIRFKKHKEASKYSSKSLYSDMRLYGVDKFHMIILEEVNTKDMYKKEVEWIEKLDSYNSGYNMTLGGEGGNTYSKRSKEDMIETRKKLSESKKGSKNGNKGQYIGELNPMYKSYPHNKILYLYDIKNNNLKKVTASEVKKLFNLNRLREVKELCINKVEINGYLIVESQETIEKLALTNNSK